MALLKSSIGGGLLYKGYFTSAALNNTIDVKNSIFGKDIKFIPSSTRDYNVFNIPVTFNRADKWDCFLEFYCSCQRANYCLSGCMTSNWWIGFGININYSQALNAWRVNLNVGVSSQNYWGSDLQRSTEIITNDKLNTIRVIHLPNTDNYRWWVNNHYEGEFTNNHPYYGTFNMGIGGIYQNSDSLLYNTNNHGDYMTSRTYLKINDNWLTRNF